MGTAEGDRVSLPQQILEGMLALAEKREEFDKESIKALRQLVKAGTLKDKAKVVAILEADKE